MTIPKPHLSNPNQKNKNHQIFVTQPRPEPTKEEENDRWRFRCVIRYLWQLQRSWVSLCQTHTNLDSNPNPKRSTNANSLFHGCGTPKLVSVAPDRSLQLGTSSSGGEEKLENSQTTVFMALLIRRERVKILVRFLMQMILLLVDLLLGLCLCFWVCGFWFSILEILSLGWCSWYYCSRYFQILINVKFDFYFCFDFFFIQLKLINYFFYLELTWHFLMSKNIFYY